MKSVWRTLFMEVESYSKSENKEYICQNTRCILIFITLVKYEKTVDVQHKEQTRKESVENSLYAGRIIYM